MEGRIVKGVGGFYYVLLENNEVVECRASGIFRKLNIKPTIGDYVKIRFESNQSIGYVEEVFKRRNQLIRPYISNVDQVLLISSVEAPAFNHWLVDRLILMFKYSGLTPVLLISKSELDMTKAMSIKDDYIKSGFAAYCISSYIDYGIADFEKIICGKVSVLAGVSGSGKSTLINKLGKYELVTGDISRKTDRGRHTTRHSEWLIIDNKTAVIDTPGFSSVDLNFIKDEQELKHFFTEFEKYSQKCRFKECVHINEPSCAVKDALKTNDIVSTRYENYKSFYDEIREKRRF